MVDGGAPTEPRVEDRVVLLSPDARPIGQAGKEAAHRSPGRRHLAFSVMLQDEDGRFLLQRRALTKHHFRGFWANSCCSHPSPGEGVLAAAHRRLGQELGLIEQPTLRSVGAFWYQAHDEDSGLAEFEYDVVVTGTVGRDLTLRPDPAEVESIRWVPRDQIRRRLASIGDRVAPWLPQVIAALENPGAPPATFIDL